MALFPEQVYFEAEPNENAFQRRELAEYGVEVRKAENYSSTAVSTIALTVDMPLVHHPQSFSLPSPKLALDHSFDITAR